MSKYLTLELDYLFQGEYYYTDYDLGGSGHSITINVKDKEKFLDQFAAIWRERAEEFLEENEYFEE